MRLSGKTTVHWPHVGSGLDEGKIRGDKPQVNAEQG